MSPTPLERIRVISLYDGENDLAHGGDFKYEWHDHGDGSGYEVFETKNFSYRGVYHPGDGRCKGNPCLYCGRGHA